MSGKFTTTKLELAGNYIGPIWMPNIVCGKYDVSVTLDRNEHKPFTDHYDGDIEYHVNRMANDGDFRYVRFTELYVVITRMKSVGATVVTRTRYINISKRFEDMMADDEMLGKYYEQRDRDAYNDEEDAA